MLSSRKKSLASWSATAAPPRIAKTPAFPRSRDDKNVATMAEDDKKGRMDLATHPASQPTCLTLPYLPYLPYLPRV
jgi:hypothetical protein